MTDTQIDRILSEDEILPSSGFVSSVMDAVRREATAPPPIPFPWKRALPFVVLDGGALVLLAAVAIFAVANLGGLPASNTPAAAPMSLLSLSSLSGGTLGPVLAWSGLALAAAFISVFVSLRLVGGES